MKPISYDCPAGNDAHILAGRLGALAHPARMAILRQLAANECCCCKDVVQHLDLAQSTVSQHLKVLVSAGLVLVTPDAQRSLYRIDREAVAGLADNFGRLLQDCCGSNSCNDN